MSHTPTTVVWNEKRVIWGKMLKWYKGTTTHSVFDSLVWTCTQLVMCHNKKKKNNKTKKDRRVSPLINKELRCGSDHSSCLIRMEEPLRRTEHLSCEKINKGVLYFSLYTVFSQFLAAFVWCASLVRAISLCECVRKRCFITGLFLYLSNQRTPSHLFSPHFLKFFTHYRKKIN